MIIYVVRGTLDLHTDVGLLPPTLLLVALHVLFVQAHKLKFNV